MALTWDDNSHDTPLLSGYGQFDLWLTSLIQLLSDSCHPPYGRGQWSKGRIPLPTTLIPAAANRETAWTVEDVAADATEVVVQGAAPGNGPGQDGGGPPIFEVGHVAEISAVIPKAARQGREARRIGGPRIRRIPATRCGLSCCALQ